MASKKSSDGLMLVLAVIALLLSVVGFIVSSGVFNISGRVSDDGYVNATIQSQAAINVSFSEINWSLGRVSPGQIAILDSEGTISGVPTTAPNFTTQTKGFIVENIGNTQFGTLNIRAGKTALALLGGSTPTYRFRARTCNTAGICTYNAPTSTDDTIASCSAVQGVYTNLLTSNTNVCNNFLAGPLNDEVRIDIQLSFADDATGGVGGIVTDIVTIEAL